MSVSIRVFVIEDSPLQQKKTQAFIKQAFKETYNFDVTVVPLLNLNEFYEDLSLTTFYATDIFIIDYDLNSYFNGIDVAKRIKTYHPEAIISMITAYPNQAISLINAYIEPVAYIVKEADTTIMEANLLQLVKHVALSLQKLNKDEQSVIIAVGTEKKLIARSSICYISTIKQERNRVFIELQKEQLIASASWKEMCQLFSDKDHFIQFKSYIFNLEAISHYSRTEKFIRFKNDTSLFLGSKILDRLIKEIERKHSK